MIDKKIKKLKEKYKKNILKTEIIVKPGFGNVPLRPINISFNNNLNKKIK